MDINRFIRSLFSRIDQVEEEFMTIKGVGYKSWWKSDFIFVGDGTLLRNIEYENTLLYHINSISRYYYDISDVDVHYFSRQSNTWSQDIFS